MGDHLWQLDESHTEGTNLWLGGRMLCVKAGAQTLYKQTEIQMRALPLTRIQQGTAPIRISVFHLWIGNNNNNNADTTC